MLDIDSNPFDEFAILTDKELREFAEGYNEDGGDDIDEFSDAFCCPNCGSVLTFMMDGSECSGCGIIINKEISAKSTRDSSAIKVNIGGNRNVFCTVSYHTTQKKYIKEELETLNENSIKRGGMRIPPNIIEDVAEVFNQMQTVKIVNKKKPGEEKKFVIRQKIKYAVLGTILLYKCREHALPYRENNIKRFMGIYGGLSRGQAIVRYFVFSGKINSLQVNIDTSEDYVDRFLRLLKLMDHSNPIPSERSQRYKMFVLSLVKDATAKKVGHDSTVISKIVGTIWLLICRENLNISSAEVETAVQKVRKNTFTRFSKAIDRNILMFIDIFDKYKIPHLVKRRLVRVKNPLYVGGR